MHIILFLWLLIITVHSGVSFYIFINWKRANNFVVLFFPNKTWLTQWKDARTTIQKHYLLAGLPACTIKPLQLIQNAAARVVFNEPKKSSRYSSLHQVTLATNSRSHQIQGTDVCLQDHNWHCTNIPKLASSNLCALQKLAFCKWTTSCGAIPKRVPNHSHGPLPGLCPAGGMTLPISIRTAES